MGWPLRLGPHPSMLAAALGNASLATVTVQLGLEVE